MVSAVAIPRNCFEHQVAYSHWGQSQEEFAAPRRILLQCGEFYGASNQKRQPRAVVPTHHDHLGTGSEERAGFYALSFALHAIPSHAPLIISKLLTSGFNYHSRILFPHRDLDDAEPLPTYNELVP